MLDSFSQEQLIVRQVPKNEHNFHDDPEMYDILCDFEKLDFENILCTNAEDVINYNDGKEADPFDKIAKYYGRKKNIFLFISMIEDNLQSEKIIDIISKKCSVQAKENFIKRMKIYLDRIGKGKRDAEEILESGLAAFFNGYHVACPGHERNVHENININITKPEQALVTSHLFAKNMGEDSEVKRAKIYSNGKRILTIKNMNKQRNYSFTKSAMCDVEIIWGAEDEPGNLLNCAVVLNLNNGQINVKESTISNEKVELNDIIELAKQNEAILFRDKALHEVVAECFHKQS